MLDICSSNVIFFLNILFQDKQTDSFLTRLPLCFHTKFTIFNSLKYIHTALHARADLIPTDDSALFLTLQWQIYTSSETTHSARDLSRTGCSANIYLSVKLDTRSFSAVQRASHAALILWEAFGNLVIAKASIAIIIAYAWPYLIFLTHSKTDTMPFAFLGQFWPGRMWAFKNSRSLFFLA